MDIIEEKINDNSNITANSRQLEILKKNFPNCFDKEGNFIAHKMEEIVTGNGLELSRESYSLNWLGKSYARLLANENPRTMLREDREHNTIEENKTSQNILIKGDNLEVLKHLKNAYENQIKMIYIDPPYNTGNDFVYNDDRKFSIDELSSLAGVSYEEAKRIMDFTASKSNSHSAWLTFMYPRLYVARELLKDDGVIFISIDDNEVAQLRLLCDEVFGEENFVANIIWQKKYARQNDSKGLSMSHEHILLYSKNKDIWTPNKVNRSDEKLKGYKNIDNDNRGDWQSVVYTCNKTRAQRPNLYYPIVNPHTGEEVYPDESRVWAYEQKRTEKMIEENRLWWGTDGKLKKPRLKTFLNEVGIGVVPDTIWLRTDVGDTQDSARQIKSIFKNPIFDTPKPIKLIMRALEISTTKDDLILDFFAGSGTTAH
ncbi:MAG: site-specific DNA-methyltransferase, partial [Campylobacterales bacterium]|nr:site-specific DNA-methyltransferase [Campylobacterales bacterium]